MSKEDIKKSLTALHLADRIQKIISLETDDETLMLDAFIWLLAFVIESNEDEDNDREEIAANIMNAALKILNGKQTVH